MGGLGVFAWLAIGSAAGWVISRLMVSAEDDALRGTAAGMVGGILGGLGMRLLEPSPGVGANALDASLAALAGSLWLTWITCAVTSGRRRDSGALPPQVRFAVREPASEVETAGPTLAYVAARDQLVDQLLRDAVAHEGERYDEIGRRLDSLAVVPHGAARELGRLRVAVAFWDGWIDARNRGWKPDSGIAKSEWPLLARAVAADLEDDRDVTDARVMTHFDVGSRPSLANRLQAVAARMRVG
jgi:uncharacterized membrane protein YeaQ/YmgE (transglycosylase-associated protein family)